jgi:hypothetical protein
MPCVRSSEVLHAACGVIADSKSESEHTRPTRPMRPGGRISGEGGDCIECI